MTLLVLVVSEALLVGAAALAVRAQFSLFRGFDLIVSAAVVASAEISLTVMTTVPTEKGIALVAGAFAAANVSIGMVSVWNLAVARLLERQSSPGTFLFVFSLGASIAVAGLVGIVRGPGLRQAATGTSWLSGSGTGIPESPLIGSVVGIALLVVLVIIMRHRRWLALDLLAQDEEFANEVGVEISRVAISAGVLTGASAAFAGWYMAHANGSTPEVGLQVFLLGAGGALLLPGRRLLSAVSGGLLLGALHVFLQLVVAPSLSQALLFMIVLGLVVFRGTSRKKQEVR